MFRQESGKHGRSRGISFLLSGEPTLSDLSPEQHEADEQPESQDDSFHLSNLWESGLHCGHQGSSMGNSRGEHESGMVHMD